MGSTKAPKIVKSSAPHYTTAEQKKRNLPNKQVGDYPYDTVSPSQLWAVQDKVKYHNVRKTQLEKFKRKEQESIPPPRHDEMAGTPDNDVSMDESVIVATEAPKEDIDRLDERPVHATDVEMRMKFNEIYYQISDAPIPELGDFWSHNLFSVLNRPRET